MVPPVTPLALMVEATVMLPVISGKIVIKSGDWRTDCHERIVAIPNRNRLEKPTGSKCGGQIVEIRNGPRVQEKNPVTASEACISQEEFAVGGKGNRRGLNGEAASVPTAGHGTDIDNAAGIQGHTSGIRGGESNLPSVSVLDKIEEGLTCSDHTQVSHPP